VDRVGGAISGLAGRSRRRAQASIVERGLVGVVDLARQLVDDGGDALQRARHSPVHRRKPPRRETHLDLVEPVRRPERGARILVHGTDAAGETLNNFGDACTSASPWPVLFAVGLRGRGPAPPPAWRSGHSTIRKR
jgi:hypothetical protein